MSVLDAVYFTVETIGTIGYGDFSFADQHPWLRSYAVGLMLLGVVLAAPWFVGAALGLDVLGTFYVDRLPFMVGRLTVPTGGGLDGLAMGELSARTRVVAIHRAGQDDSERRLEYPPRNTRFGAGDDAYLFGPYEELLAVLRRDVLAPGSVRPSTGPTTRADGSTPEDGSTRQSGLRPG
ncbi:MAG: ion channel [Actinomycetota bacterium]|nr:ion channel [Actinomycetota bacterium]